MTAACGALVLAAGARRSRCCGARARAARFSTTSSLSVKTRRLDALLLFHQGLQFPVHYDDLQEKNASAAVAIDVHTCVTQVRFGPPPRCL
jgi:hypothetical protein